MVCVRVCVRLDARVMERERGTSCLLRGVLFRCSRECSVCVCVFLFVCVCLVQTACIWECLICSKCVCVCVLIMLYVYTVCTMYSE